MSKKKVPTFTETKLFDALEDLLSSLYADGPRKREFDKAHRALARFEKYYGKRHDHVWEIRK